jgi:hypothetical protein
MASYPTFDMMILAWGDWYANQNNTTLGGFATTDYGAYDQLSQYTQFQISVAYSDIVYDDQNNTGVLVDSSPQLGELTSWNNNTTGNDTLNYSDTFQIQQSFAWATANALSSTDSMTAEVAIPDIVAKFGGSMSTTLSLTQSSTVSLQNSYTHVSAESIQVPANSCLTAQAMLWNASFNIPYAAQVAFTGKVAVWTDDPVNGHYLWFKPLGNVFGDIVANSLWPSSVTSLYVPGHDNMTLYFQVQGVFSGRNGWFDQIDTEQYPVGQCPSMVAPGQKARVIRRRLLPVTGQTPGGPKAPPRT